MREEFTKALIKYASKNSKILLLTGDHGYSLFDEFRKKFPKQYINCGIAEQNMVGMAAGLARIGYRPFVYGLAAFIPIRTVEQIKLDIAHDNLPVTLIGDGAGLVYSHLGTSHQATEDIACTRSIPRIEILSPGDRYEMKACMDYAISRNRPIYLRIGKADRENIHNSDIQTLASGELLKLRSGRYDRPGLIGTGSMVSTAIKASEKFNLNVWSAPILKPINQHTILMAAKESRGLITLEEHSILGGLGGAVAEILGEIYPIRLLRLGIEDRFSENCGSYKYLLEEHKLDEDTIFKKIEIFIEKEQ